MANTTQESDALEAKEVIKYCNTIEEINQKLNVFEQDLIDQVEYLEQDDENEEDKEEKLKVLNNHVKYLKIFRNFLSLPQTDKFFPCGDRRKQRCWKV